MTIQFLLVTVPNQTRFEHEFNDKQIKSQRDHTLFVRGAIQLYNKDYVVENNIITLKHDFHLHPDEDKISSMHGVSTVMLYLFGDENKWLKK